MRLHHARRQLPVTRLPLPLHVPLSGYIIYKGNYDQHRAGNTSKAAGCASPSRDNLSHRGQWSTLVVKNVRVIQSRTNRNLFNFPARGHSYNMPNIALWSSLLLLPHSLFLLLTLHVPGIYLCLFSIAIHAIV